jgi:hypothetical protein
MTGHPRGLNTSREFENLKIRTHLRKKMKRRCSKNGRWSRGFNHLKKKKPEKGRTLIEREMERGNAEKPLKRSVVHPDSLHQNSDTIQTFC